MNDGLSGTWSEISEGSKTRARLFAGVAVNRLGPLIDKMQLTQAEAMVAYAYLLGEVVSHQTTKANRQFTARQMHEMVLDVAENFAEARQSGLIR